MRRGSSSKTQTSGKGTHGDELENENGERDGDSPTAAPDKLPLFAGPGRFSQSTRARGAFLTTCSCCAPPLCRARGAFCHMRQAPGVFFPTTSARGACCDNLRRARSSTREAPTLPSPTDVPEALSHVQPAPGVRSATHAAPGVHYSRQYAAVVLRHLRRARGPFRDNAHTRRVLRHTQFRCSRPLRTAPVSFFAAAPLSLFFLSLFNSLFFSVSLFLFLLFFLFILSHSWFEDLFMVLRLTILGWV